MSYMKGESRAQRGSPAGEGQSWTCPQVCQVQRPCELLPQGWSGAFVQIGDNNSSHLMGLLGGLNELRGVKPLDQLLSARQQQHQPAPARSYSETLTVIASGPAIMRDEIF